MRRILSFVINMITRLRYLFSHKIPTLIICINLASLHTIQAQSLAWVKNIGGTSSDLGKVIQVDSDGSIYIIGTFEGDVDFDPSTTTTQTLTSNGNRDIFFAKYNSNGELQWAKNIGSANSETLENAVLDANGNLYITGTLIGANSVVDFDPNSGTQNLTHLSSSAKSSAGFVAKYNTNGEYQWAFALTSTDSLFELYDIKLDASNNLLITGYFNGADVDFDPNTTTTNNLTTASNMFLAKYDTDGVHQWAFAIDGASNGMGLAIDASSNVYVSGYIDGSSVDFDPSANTTSFDAANGTFFLAKYNSSGEYQSAQNFGNNTINTISDRLELATDSSNDLYLCGSFSGNDAEFNPSGTSIQLSSEGSQDIFIAKYNSSLALQWVKGIGSTEIDIPQSIVVDGSNNLVITGYFNGTVDFDPSANNKDLVSNGSDDIFLAEYDSFGDIVLAYNFGGTASDQGLSTYVNSVGTIYLTGSIASDNVDFDPSDNTSDISTNGSSDIFISKYGLPEINLKANSASLASGDIYDFGSIASGSSSSDVIFMVENLGATNLTLSGTAGNLVVLDGTDVADFVITQTNVTSSIAGESNVTFTVLFNPSSIGTKNTTLTINSNDEDEGTYTVDLTGIAVAADNGGDNEDDNPLSVSNENKIGIYPNPAVEVVSIADASVKYAVVYNLMGAKVYAAELENGTLNVKSLRKGLYVLTLMDGVGNILSTNRLMKE